ncbi:hypothetical protein Trydic_g9092 [Trypoxylus dichotomus]
MGTVEVAAALVRRRPLRDVAAPDPCYGCQSQGQLIKEEGKWLVRIVGECAEADRHISVSTAKSQLNQTTFNSASKSITRIRLGEGESPAP